jgi:hypothetical protein
MEDLFNMKQMVNNIITKLSLMCLPSQIYLAMGLLIILITLGNSKKTIIGKIFYISYIGLIAFIFDILCKSGYEFIVWFLLILPFIIIPIVLFISTVKLMKTIKVITNNARTKKNKKL